MSPLGGVDAGQRPLEGPEAPYFGRLAAQVLEKGGVLEIRGDAPRRLQ
jgi:hypothetical protein